MCGNNPSPDFPAERGKVTLSLKPAPADYGIRFQRADLGGIEIPAHVTHLSGPQQLQTGLVHEQAAVRCDAVLALGSTLSVYPAAAFPLMAARRGVPYAIVNRGPTEHDGFPDVTVRVEGDVGTIFPPAVALALADRSP